MTQRQPTHNISVDGFTSIADDFTAPDEATKPYQDQLVRIRMAFGAHDGRWINVHLILKSLDLSENEQAAVDAFIETFTPLNNAILNKQNVDLPDQQPAKGTQVTR